MASLYSCSCRGFRLFPKLTLQQFFKCTLTSLPIRNNPDQLVESHADQNQVDSDPYYVEGLNEESQKCFDEMRAMYPYHCPWKLPPHLVDKLNNTAKISEKAILLNNLNNLEVIEMTSATKRARKQNERAEVLSEYKDSGEYIPYTLFLWIRNSAYNLWYSNQLRHTYQFGRDVVLDCGFEHLLRGREKLYQRYVDQFDLLFRNNRAAESPVKIWLCNLAEDSPLRRTLTTGPEYINPHNFVNMTSKSYTEVFDPERLVYLSPESPNWLKEIDPEAVYIIGGLTDTGGEFIRETTAKSRREGIRSARLPTPKHIYRGGGTVPYHRMFLLMNHVSTMSLPDALEKIIPQSKRMNINDLREVSAKAFTHHQKLVKSLKKKVSR